MINKGDPIDADSINDIDKRVDNLATKLVHLFWKNGRGKDVKAQRSMDGKKLQILAGTVPVTDKVAKDDQVGIRVRFYNPFGGKKDPTVIAMPESASPYGVSVKGITNEEFILVIHQFANGPKDDNLNLSHIHYIAIGPA